MPRKPREEEAGAVHHVWARGVERRRIFVDDHDREDYLRLLRWAAWVCKWRLRAYCLMPNHVHLVIETPEPNLGEGIRVAHGMYAQGFNERHSRVGHLFQGRYGASRIHTDEALGETLEYVALNPVRAGLCARPADFPWSWPRGPSLA